MKRKRRLATKRMTAEIKGRLRASLIQSRRNTIYKMEMKRHGVVRCFCCHEPVSKDEASVEHILATSKGGTDDLSNLAISHINCNQKRGNQ